MDPVLERCTTDDADVLTEVAHAAKRHWGYPESYIEAWREALTVRPAMVLEHEVWSCRVDDAVAGFYVLIHSGEGMELEHCWVRPEFMGRGIGRRLMVHAMERASAAGARRIEITSDPNAEGFYDRLGARRIGQVSAPVVGTERFLPRLVLEVPPST